MGVTNKKRFLLQGRGKKYRANREELGAKIMISGEKTVSCKFHATKDWEIEKPNRGKERNGSARDWGRPYNLTGVSRSPSRMRSH